MTDFLAALGLVLMIEGALYALIPDAMKRAVRMVLEMSPATMRGAGLFSTILGLVVIWSVRG
jgi:hypothetical protein